MTAGALEAPLGFKIEQGRTRSGVITGDPSRDYFTVEARQAGHHFKDGIVQEGLYGSRWRLASDEGLHLKGTDLAPSPLGLFNAALQADLAGRVAAIARRRGIVLRHLEAGVSTQYSLTGSFALGTGRGFAEAVGAHVAFDADASDDVLARVVADAVVQSPLFDLVTRPLVNTFALYCNGRRRSSAEGSASPLAQSTAASPADPFLKYKAAPEPTGHNDGTDADVGPIMVRTGETIAQASDQAEERHTPGQSWITFNGEGRYDPASGIYRSTSAADRKGATVFGFATDDGDGDRLPSGLALASAAIAFCYMTQLSRYIDGLDLAIRGVRLVQSSPFFIDEVRRGEAGPCDTHLFLQGEATEEEFERLQVVAANTCYLHQTMHAAVPLKVTVSSGGRMLG